jgi:His-Xaa-Ser system protein HxsD
MVHSDLDFLIAPNGGINLEPPFALEFCILIDIDLYPREALLRTCYALTDRCYIWLSRQDGSQVKVSFRRKDQALDVDLLKAEFANALLDFALRVDVEERTRVIREALVTTALAEATTKSQAKG